MTAKIAKTRTPPLTISEKFSLMSMVQAMAPAATATDTEIAKQASAQLKRPVHVSTIKQTREAFNVAQFKAPSQAELLAQVRSLQRELSLRATDPIPVASA